MRAPAHFPAQAPRNAVSLLMEGAPPNALLRTLENYGLPPVELQKGRGPLKPKVPEEELTHVQKMQRARNEIKTLKRREGGLWDPNVYGGGILQRGSAIRYYMLGHISQHKGPYGKYLGMLNALKDTDGYPRCDLSGIRFTWKSQGEWPFSLKRIDNKDPSHGEDNVELIAARCNAVERESYGATDLRTMFTDMFKPTRARSSRVCLGQEMPAWARKRFVRAWRQRSLSAHMSKGEKELYKRVQHEKLAPPSA
ncbi:hypothetical protein T492DRAFT_885231 [Pavlovales sp. CCMP2436]|nr:hypothetical protein T492DRAFT_885231 [Pavlovales sp. CCMP2436]